MKSLRWLLVIMACCWAGAAGAAPAAKKAIAYPSPERVLEAISGADEADTLARKLAALEVWRDAMKALEKPPQGAGQGFAQPLGAIYGGYTQAGMDIHAALPPRFNEVCTRGLHTLFTTCHKRELVEATSRYRASALFVHETLSRQLAPAEVDRVLNRAVANEQERQQWLDQRRADSAAQLQRQRSQTLSGLAQPWEGLAWLALISLAWLLPAVVIFTVIASDKQEMVSSRVELRDDAFNTYRGTIKTPTGRIIQGDPSGGRFAALLWTLGVPLAVLGYGLAAALRLPTAAQAGVAVAMLVVAFFATRWLNDARTPLAGGLRRVLLWVLALAGLNALAWGAFLLFRLVTS